MSLKKYLPEPVAQPSSTIAGLVVSGQGVGGSGEGIPTAEAAQLSTLSSSENSVLSPEPSVLCGHTSPVTRHVSLDSAPVTDHGSRITVPMGFATSFSVSAANLTDSADDQPLTGPSRPWLQDFVVSSSVLTDDPNRDLLVMVSG